MCRRSRFIQQNIQNTKAQVGQHGRQRDGGRNQEVWWAAEAGSCGLERGGDALADDARFGGQFADIKAKHGIDLAVGGHPANPLAQPVVQVWIDQEGLRITAGVYRSGQRTVGVDDS